MLVFKKPREPNANPRRPNAKPHGPNGRPHGPNESWWNIGPVGSPPVGACVGHVHFILFVTILISLGSQLKAIFGGIWDKEDEVKTKKTKRRQIPVCNSLTLSVK